MYPIATNRTTSEEINYMIATRNTHRPTTFSASLPRHIVDFPTIILSIFLSLQISLAYASSYDRPITEESLAQEEIYSPYVDRAYPDQVLFGDTHFHTNLSFDAGLVGTKLGIDEGFRFARGEKVYSNSGQPVQLIRPLDFLVVTDHAEFIGLAPMIHESNPVLLADPWGKDTHDLFHSGPEGRVEAYGNIIVDAVRGINPFSSEELTQGIWGDFITKTDTYNEPGRFTAMSGFEYTSTPLGDNLHRVVIFEDGANKTSQTLPFSMFDSADPEQLWNYLANYEEKTGGRVLAIPHNGNLSNGLMFSTKTFDGNEITRAYAEKRLHWEPIVEVTQMKGDGETHPLLSPDDTFADYEQWDLSNLAGTAAKTEDMLQYEYTRSALKLGLKLGKEIGVNPYKFGMIGASDTHTALSTTREENYFGKYKSAEPGPNRHETEVVPAQDPSLRIFASQELASGLTAVWARENTRSDIFSAMKRKEVYATTGTRIRVRVFAGWDFKADEVNRADFVAQGYRRGVPMGGELSASENGNAPNFMIRAIRDPDGANLDRIQMIKGWLDTSGETHERVYDVAVSDGREISGEGRTSQPVGNTVDIDMATYTNDIGDTILAAHWTDPDFDPNEHAFYYVRVLEIPTPRWTTYDAAFYNIKRPDNVPATTQDRAYTSPVWYTPNT